FSCGLCRLSFKRSFDLRRHSRTHTREKPFLCPTPGCDKAYTRKDAVYRHLVQSHFLRMSALPFSDCCPQSSDKCNKTEKHEPKANHAVTKQKQQLVQ
ncbi:hypothetical protein K466DRAFT_508163, partial [Polyporus arcularius HHB13444]